MTKSTVKEISPKKAATPKKSAAPAVEAKIESAPEELFIDELKDIYWAKKNLVKTLPKLRKAANSQELSAAFADHLAQTQERVARLEEVFSILGKTTSQKM